mgnify:CR=1 FL=1
MVNMLIPLDINSCFAEKNAKEHKSTKHDSPCSEPTTPHSNSFNEDLCAEGSVLSSKTQRHSQLTTNDNIPNSGDSNQKKTDDNLSLNCSDSDSGYDPTKIVNTGLLNCIRLHLPCLTKLSW